MKYLNKLRILLGIIGCALFFSSCGGVSGAPPVNIPAPTGGFLSISAPDANDSALSFGQIVVADSSSLAAPIVSKSLDTPLSLKDTVKANTTVWVTNTRTSERAVATTDDNGYFNTNLIDTIIGDSVNIQYVQSGQLSNATAITVTARIQQMITTNMVLQDVDINPSTGIAYFTANDGINSEILVVNVVTGEIVDRYEYSNKLFTKISLNTEWDYAAVIDPTNSKLYWCDIITGTDDCQDKAVAMTPHSVATIGETTVSGMVVVGYDYDSVNARTLAIYRIEVSGLLGDANAQCILSPDDASYPLSVCSPGLSNPLPSVATNMALTEDGSGNAILAAIVDYANGTVASFFTNFSEAAGLLWLDSSTMFGANFTSATADPYDLRWYNTSLALVTDDGDGALITLDGSGGLIRQTSVAVAANPRGVYPDATNTRAFVAAQGTDLIYNVTITGITPSLSGTTYRSNFNPDGVVYYSDGTSSYLGVVDTFPESLINTIVLP